jgi:hypothetical protein
MFLWMTILMPVLMLVPVPVSVLMPVPVLVRFCSGLFRSG